jgi:hypothetical protein
VNHSLKTGPETLSFAAAMPRLAFGLILGMAALAGRAQDAPTLAGKLDGDSYVSPTGAFRVKIPVSEDLGGIISDTANVVTFSDHLTTHISIAAWPMDTTQRWELSTRGTRDYLAYFFNTYVLPDFKQTFPATHVENEALFMPTAVDGALIAYVLIPGGSMFSGQSFIIDPTFKPREAKRANLLFVKNGLIYVVSSELAERITEGSAYTMTREDENSTLRERLLDIVHGMQFLKASAPVSVK